ncbi:hypothetical protein AB0J74_07060 [Asanoa sp. NPDC049573]|uniref:hypothetical protein n=1 Tax=Asanoa sp. NPDC049573 TaxID=3155396 RepID=UPI00343AD998
MSYGDVDLSKTNNAAPEPPAAEPAPEAPAVELVPAAEPPLAEPLASAAQPTASTLAEPLTPAAPSPVEPVTPAASSPAELVTPAASSPAELVTPAASSPAELVTPAASSPAELVTPASSSPAELVTPAAPSPAEPVTPALPPTVGAPVQPGQPLPVAGLTPPPKRRRGLIVGLVVAFLVLLLEVSTVVVIATGDPAPSAVAAPMATATPAAAPTGPPPSPKPGDSENVRFAWALDQIRTSLATMTKGMRDGNLGAFVKPAADKKVRAELDRRFRSLRAMKVAGFDLSVDSGPVNEKKVGGFSQWNVRVGMAHCFAVATCKPSTAVFDTVWRDSPTGYRMTKISAIEADANGPHPWEVSALTAAVGKRAVVAAPKNYAAKARAFLPLAERAAKTADKYVLGDKPDRYVVYLAGPAEWKKWFGGSEDWAVGFAIPATRTRSDIVLRMEDLSSSYAESVLKHEMGHVATLSGRDYRAHTGDDWWLTEGIAEFIEWDKRGVAAYDRKQSSRRLIRERKFTGNLEKLVPDDDAPDWQIDAAYGLGYYATSCIAAQYGHKKLMTFVDQLLREGRPASVVSDQYLGVPWPTVTKRCFTYTKQKLGV